MPRIVLKENESDKALEVPETDATLGRDPACGFFIEGPNSKVVSARHARIFFQDGAWWIEDSSRNGTILDDERLQRGQRHALKVGQVIGLGESGPRYRVVLLDSRLVAQTVVELPAGGGSVSTPPAEPAPGDTAPRGAPPREAHPEAPAEASAAPGPTQAMIDARTAAIRYSEAIRAGLNVDERTEPAEASSDWHVHVVLRAVHSNQRFEARAESVKLGRAPECSVQVPPEHGASVSRVHAEIAIHGAGVVLQDIGSRNGTYLNGQRIDAAHPAARNDKITLGSGGPTYVIEELRILKATAPQDGGDAGGGERPRTVGARPSHPEPPTAPTNLAARGPVPPATQLADSAPAKPAGRTTFLKNILEDLTRKGTRRVRAILWSSVLVVAVIAAAVVALMQWRLNQSERLMSAERIRLEARTDSIRSSAGADAVRLRAEFDSARASSAPRAVVDSLREALADAARHTEALELSLTRARQSLEQQLAVGETTRRRAEDELTRLRSEIGRAQSADAGSRATLDSLRRALRGAEEKSNDIASQVRAVRGANLAQVAQLNQSAVGLLVWLAGPKVTSGSGFAITPSGYFVTNRHVVTDDSGRVRDSIFVTMADQKFSLGTRIQVVALGAGDVDIAIVKIPDYRGPYMKKVDWTAAGAVQGEPAALIGFPYGIDLAFDDTASSRVRTSMSAGIFSKVATDRIQFDGFTIGGSSGSPVFNSAGEVVAVHRQGLRTGPGLSFSIPVSRVLPLLPAEARSELGLR